MRLLFALVFGLLTLGAIPASAQTDPVPQPATTLQPDELPPLDRILAYAVAHSPRLKQQDALVEQNRQQVGRVRLEWLDGITAGVSSTYGSYGNAVLDEIAVGVQGTVGVRLSVLDMIGGKSRRNLFRQELEVARQKREEVRVEEQSVVIDLYHRLELAGRLVSVHSGALQAAQVHEQMAETEFAQADIPVSELARVTEIASKAQAEYETARSSYLSLYAQLENLLGVSLDQFDSQ